MAKFLSLLALFLLIAADYSYAGNSSKTVTIEEVNGTLDIQSGITEVDLSYTIINNDDDIELSTQKGKAKIRKGKNEAVMLKHAATTAKSKKTGSARVLTHIDVDGEKLLIPAKKYAVKVILPQEATRLLKSNKKLAPSGRESGRLAYTWQGNDHYLSSFYVWWTTSKTDISLSKTIIPDWDNGKAKVIIDIKNDSVFPARSIVLKEDFHSQSFSGVTKESEGTFRDIRGETNDSRLSWEYPVSELGGGQQKRVAYVLELKHAMDEIPLYETRAIEEGEVIALSEAVSARR